MKRLVFIVSMVIVTAVAAAQTNGGAMIKFSDTSHDYGQFREEAGPQSYSFSFENSGSSDILITNVVVSCGCATPEWTKSPVRPGSKGFVKVTYDPRNRPGKFKKTVTVYSNTNPPVSVLVIEGDVTPRVLTVEEIYRFPVESVRLTSNHLAFTDVARGEKKIKVMEVINTSDKPVKIGFDRVPDHLQLKARPETLQPGAKGIIEGTYDGGKKDDWGYVNDLVRLVLNDAVVNNIYMVVSANLTEDFASMSSAQIANAPIASFEITQFDFGTIKQNEKADVRFKFKNTGKSDLIIRKVRSSCGCTTVTPSNIVIKPGENSYIDAVFDAGVRKGRQHKVINIITNDPKNSQVNLIVSGDVAETSK